MKRFQASDNVESLVFENLPSKRASSGATRTSDFSYYFPEKNSSWKASAANAAVQSVIGKLAQVDDATHKVKGNLYMTGVERAQAVAPARKEAYDAINRVLSVN